jgi:hypothetical protein
MAWLNIQDAEVAEVAQRVEFLRWAADVEVARRVEGTPELD